MGSEMLVKKDTVFIFRTQYLIGEVYVCCGFEAGPVVLQSFCMSGSYSRPPPEVNGSLNQEGERGKSGTFPSN